MAAEEPIREQVIAAIKARLEGIRSGDASAEGWTYWYSPAAVVRHHELDESCLDESLGGGQPTIYVLIPDRRDMSNATSRERDARIEFDLALAKRWAPGDENPHTLAAPNREQVQARLAADAEARLTDDPTFADYQGFNVSLVQVMSEDMSAEATYYPGWAIALLRVAVEYRNLAGHP